MKRTVGAAVLWVAATSMPALSCGFHTVTAEPTLVELLLASEDIAVLRSSDGAAAPLVEVLRGTADGAAGLVEAGPVQGAVLMARTDPYGPWEPLADLTPALSDVVDAVLARSDVWLYDGDAARAGYFAGLMDHDDPAVRALALRELDLVTYGVLRDTVQAPDPSPLLAARAVAGPDDDLRAIRVLLLGLTGDDGARDAVRDGLAAAVMRDDWARILGAYAVALMELDGPDGVARLDQLVLADPAQAMDKIELVVEAMAIQRTEGDPALRPAIDAALSALVAARPQAAEGVARQLGVRADWSQHAGLRQALASRQIGLVADMIAVSTYISVARDELGLETEQP